MYSRQGAVVQLGVSVGHKNYSPKENVLQCLGLGKILCNHYYCWLWEFCKRGRSQKNWTLHPSNRADLKHISSLHGNSAQKTYCSSIPPLRSGVRDRVSHVGFCGGQSGAGVDFLRVLRFPLPNVIPPIAPKIILIYHRGLYNRPKWPQYQGLR
jgi:hypothetical protein